MGISKAKSELRLLSLMNHLACDLSFNHEARNAHFRRSRRQDSTDARHALGSASRSRPAPSARTPRSENTTDPEAALPAVVTAAFSPNRSPAFAQNEYSIWAGQDKHARAYQVLSNDVSLRIGRILNLKPPPNQNEKCLACHALAVSADMRAQTFDISDGVSCEHCHGPAAGWLGPHTVKDWEAKNGRPESPARHARSARPGDTQPYLPALPCRN